MVTLAIGHVLVLVQEQLCRAEVHRFQPRQGPRKRTVLEVSAER